MKTWQKDRPTNRLNLLQRCEDASLDILWHWIFRSSKKLPRFVSLELPMSVQSSLFERIAMFWFATKVRDSMMVFKYVRFSSISLAFCSWLLLFWCFLSLLKSPQVENRKLLPRRKFLHAKHEASSFSWSYSARKTLFPFFPFFLFYSLPPNAR